MPALAQIDLGTLTPEQRAAAVQAIAALETLRAENETLVDRNETLAEEKACLAAEKDTLAGCNETQAARIRRLEHLNLELIRLLYGKRSERLTADERQLAFEELEGASAEVEAEAVADDPSPPRAPKRPRVERNIGHLPEHLERIEQVVEPESTLCPCGCGEMVRIGEDRSERLDIVPARLRVIVTVRPKYACRSCEQGVTQAPAPARLIEGGLPTEGAIAHVLVSKYAEHTPLYRQAQIYARSGLDLDRSTLAGWVGKASFHLRPVADRLAWHLKRSSKLFMDETRAPVLDPGRGRTKTGWLWALARDDRAWGGPDPPGVVYFYAPGRGGEYAERFLNGFDGILQVDGYAGYNRLTGPGRKGGAPIRLAYCWAHCRRRLREIYDSSGSEIAAEGLRRIAELYAIEAEIRASTPERRLAERQARSAPSGPGLRRLAPTAARRRLAQVPPRRKARLYRPPLGRPPALPRRRPRRDGQQLCRESRPADCPVEEKRIVRRPRRRRRRMGTYRLAHRDGETEPCRALRLAQGHSRSHRHRPSKQPRRRTPALELQASVKLKAGCSARIAYSAATG